MLNENKTVKIEIDICLSHWLKSDIKEMRITFFYIKATLRSSLTQMFFQKSALKIFAIFRKKTPALKSLFNKFVGPKACNSIKKDSNTGVFLRILPNFLENIFYRTPPVAVSVP